MNLYRSLGRIWSGTQADARAAQGGKDFEAIEVPTDKAGLLNFLNTFDVRPGDAPPVLTVPDNIVIPDDADWSGAGQIIPVVHHTATHGPGSAAAATSCPACQRDAHVAAMVVDAEASICARADIEDVMEIATADDLIERLQRRRAAIIDMERGPPSADPIDGVLG